MTRRAFDWMMVMLIGASPSILGLGAFGKVVDWEEWLRSVDTFSLVPGSLRGAIAAGVPMCELVPLVLFAAGRWRGAACMSLALFVLFTGVWTVHWMANERPTCSCFGLWQEYALVEALSRSWVVRNAMLIVLSAGALVAAVARRRCYAPPRDGSDAY